MFLLNFITGDRRCVGLLFSAADDEVDSVKMFEYMKCVSGLC